MKSNNFGTPENPLNLVSLREQVYLYLREQMNSGKLLAGSTIDMSELSKQLGISKTPLRDALIRLECEGYVEILPRRGVRVAALTLQDVKNLYEIIGTLEASVILSCFVRMGPTHIERLKRLNTKMRTALVDEDFDNYYILNLDFHNVYLSLSANSELQDLIRNLKQRLYDFPRRCYIKEWELSNCDEHQKFIEYLDNGDPRGAANQMRDVHWSFDVQEKFIRRFYSLMAEQLKAELSHSAR
ncbi:MAG: GntR family transcriptional regulator [Desulfoferrobacter sp.]